MSLDRESVTASGFHVCITPAQMLPFFGHQKCRSSLSRSSDIPTAPAPTEPEKPTLTQQTPELQIAKPGGHSPTQGSNHRVTVVPDDGFEPTKAEPADLQSAPFGRSGNLACTIRCAGNSTTNSPNLCKSPAQAARADSPADYPRRSKAKSIK